MTQIQNLYGCIEENCLYQHETPTPELLESELPSEKGNISSHSN